MEKFLSSLETAARTIKTADHMTYITFPLLKDKRLLIKILSEIYLAMLNIVNAVLQYEYYYKRIVLYKDARMNFNTFVEKCSSRYSISQEDVRRILDIFTIIEKHKQSPMEFVRREKLVIMSDNMQTESISIERLKEYLILTKEILRKVNEVISRKG